MARPVLEKRSRREAGTRGLSLSRRYQTIFRTAKFATGSLVGFLDTEIMVTAGTFFLYGKSSAPSSAFHSAPFILINIIAFVTGVTVAFFINESLLIRHDVERINSGYQAILTRLGRFQLILLTSNLTMIAVELLMIKEFSFPPILSIVVGAIVSFPLSYFFSIRYIWTITEHPRN